MKSYQILPIEQATALAEKINGLSWSQGKARTKGLTGTVKHNHEITSHLSLQTLAKRILAHQEVQLEAIPHSITPPKYSKYQEGDYYQSHTDAPWMGSVRTDLSCTLWLNDDYSGGELILDGKRYRGKPGEAIIYDCGMPHEVTQVTSGERICAIAWIQSKIRDPAKRRLATSFRRFLSKFEDNQELFVEGGQIHSALLRMWIEN